MSQHPAVDELAMSMFAAPADYWRARAERAEAGLVAAANGAIAALSLPGAPTRSEREEIIASLRAAIALHDGREVQAAPQGCVDVRGVLNGVIGEAVEGSPVGASVAELQAVDRAFVRLLAAGREMLRIERTQGVSDEEAEAAIEQLDAAVSGHELTIPPAPAETGLVKALHGAPARKPMDAGQLDAWFADTTDDELRAIFAARPDLAARLAAVLDAAVEPTAAPAPAQGSDERLDRAYSERNALAVAFAKMALAAGWRAGRAFDAGAEKDWRDEWRHVVYVDVPGVGQVSWHMAPAQVPLLEGLPTYAGEWDGTFLARNTDWCAFEPASAAQGGEAVIYYAANVEHGGDFNHIPISMFDQPAIFLSKEKAEQFCSFANGTGSRHEARSLTLRSIALPAAASGLAEAECIAIYDAVTRSNLTRDVKTDERKVAVVRGAQ